MERIYNTIIKFNEKRRRFLYGCIGVAFLALSIGLFIGDNEIPIKIGNEILKHASNLLVNIF